MNLRPLNDFILVKPDPKNLQTDKGIHLLDQRKDKSQSGIVLSVGPGKLSKKGIRKTPRVSIGDHIYYDLYAGYEVYYDRELFVVMKEDEICGVFEDGESAGR